MTDESKPIVDWRNDPHLSDTWKFRFDFYDRYGTNSWIRMPKEFKSAYEKLDSSDKMKVFGNTWGLFFGIIYLLVLGLWRQAALLLLIVLGLSILLLAFPALPADFILRVTGCAFGAIVAQRVNTWYYHEKTKGGAGWML